MNVPFFSALFWKRNIATNSCGNLSWPDVATAKETNHDKMASKYVGNKWKQTNMETTQTTSKGTLQDDPTKASSKLKDAQLTWGRNKAYLQGGV